MGTELRKPVEATDIPDPQPSRPHVECPVVSYALFGLEPIS